MRTSRGVKTHLDKLKKDDSVMSIKKNMASLVGAGTVYPFTTRDYGIAKAHQKRRVKATSAHIQDITVPRDAGTKPTEVRPIPT